MMLDVGVQEPERGEQTRRRRNDDPFHQQGLGHGGGEHRAVAAESEQGVLPGVPAPFGRYRPDGAHHVGGGNLNGAMGGVLERESERLGDRLFKHRARLRGIEFNGAADQIGRVDVPEDKGGVGHRGSVPP